ncbi:MAG: protein translocase subunit SecD [Yaniella sp.]|uniref:protein translocase subunit SecD n=1 Tax=Yaniella sp. TaxID=2773929 RepID=UPI00264709D3|nr:protein translocase subunit SecD [Yaniella sp.]MDN5730292.1 protein translocase subunit SecD [Yaniella sp.]MDN5814230.1 protein translocase subunit SecD [Yaniella sp.]MDN5817130.1 protein translocase subunit SecD [Yaniella sp.]MDN5837576.1 protein translocase subunit SecD [Yaniella sp.]MDN5888721.1 protein translocase subunit SecD [Yaniella sp.]
MASKTPQSRARRSLAWLTAIIVGLGIILGIGIATDNSNGVPLLALDLEGGTQMVLSPETSTGEAVTSEQMSQAVEIIRQRVDGSGVSEAEINTQGDNNVVVSMPGAPDEQTRELIQASANMEFRSVITSGPFTAVPEEERTDVSDIPEPEAEPENGSDPNWITPELYDEFQSTDCSASDANQVRDNLPADEAVIACDFDTGSKYILGPMEISGDQIDSADHGMSQTPTGVSASSWVVNIAFEDEGSAAFRDVTQRLTGMNPPQNQFAILLDGQIVSAPASQAVITDGRAQISGDFNEESAAQLAEQLEYGALPITFEVESEQQISATLGQDQLFWGLVAGLIGLGLVAVYQFFQYRALGLVTLSSIVIMGFLTYLSIVLLGWSDNYRLSLAGIAGIIVSIGLTADSFIVYFERIKDEMRNGRPFESAVNYGWDRAKRTITVSKLVNVLAAVVLYFVAVGNVRGFAFTLGLTSIADLIVVFLFTHPVMKLLATTKFFASGHPMSGMDPSLLGQKPLYQGAGRVREFRPDEAVAPQRGKKNTRSSKEAQKRQTIAERRAAERAEALQTTRSSDNTSAQEDS